MSALEERPEYCGIEAHSHTRGDRQECFIIKPTHSFEKRWKQFQHQPPTKGHTLDDEDSPPFHAVLRLSWEMEHDAKQVKTMHYVPVGVYSWSSCCSPCLSWIDEMRLERGDAGQVWQQSLIFPLNCSLARVPGHSLYSQHASKLSKLSQCRWPAALGLVGARMLREGKCLGSLASFSNVNPPSLDAKPSETIGEAFLSSTSLHHVRSTPQCLARLEPETTS